MLHKIMPSQRDIMNQLLSVEKEKCERWVTLPHSIEHLSYIHNIMKNSGSITWKKNQSLKRRGQLLRWKAATWLTMNNRVCWERCLFHRSISVWDLQTAYLYGHYIIFVCLPKGIQLPDEQLAIICNVFVLYLAGKANMLDDTGSKLKVHIHVIC